MGKYRQWILKAEIYLTHANAIHFLLRWENAIRIILKRLHSHVYSLCTLHLLSLLPDAKTPKLVSVYYRMLWHGSNNSLFYNLIENTLFQLHGIWWNHGMFRIPVNSIVQIDLWYKTLQRCTKQKFRFKYVHPVERWTSKVYVLAHKHATTSCCLPLQRVFSTLTSRNNAVTFHLVNELWLSLLSSTFIQNYDE